MSSWRWSYLDSSGTAMTGTALPTTAFTSQSDAESWVGESWPQLAQAGVDAVVLHEDDHVVYGPMSLSDGS